MLLLNFFLSLSLPFASADVACELKSATRCLCSHSLRVSCPTNEGYIDNKTPITKLTLRVIDDLGGSKEITLANPPGTVREYYAAEYSDWVKAQLKASGVQSYKQVSMIGFSTKAEPNLFEDSQGKTPAEKEAASNQVSSRKSKPTASTTSQPDGIQCSPLSEPLVIKSAKVCGTKSLCYLKVSCNKIKGGQIVEAFGETDAACEVLSNQKCPSATACANDPSVDIGLAAQNGTRGANTDSSTKGTR